MNTDPTPPRFARRALQWWARNADIEDLIGDIDESFGYNLEQKGRIKANLIYFHHVLSLCFSYALRKRKISSSYSNHYHSNSLAMINNYFKIAIRNFSKHKLFTSINILGLALGMSICLLALSIAVSIYRSDGFHEHKDRIFQINTYFEDESRTKTYASTFNALGTHILEQYPFIEKVVRIKQGFSPEFKLNENLFNFHGYYADSTFFEVFSFSLISGNPRTVLSKPFDIVLTKSVAEKLYNDKDPIGKTLETEFATYTITGVMEDLKETHFYFEILTSHLTYEELHSNLDLKNDWINHWNNFLYVMLKPGTDEPALSQSLEQMSLLAMEFNPDQKIQLEYIDLDSVVPRWNVSNAIGIGWDQPSMIFFLSIGLIILLPAVFNYTNLSIARALKRAREIGIRKVVGADKRQIKAQFIVETVLLTLLSLIGSVIILIPLRNEFLEMVRAAEVLDTSWNLTLLLVFLIFTLMVGTVSGIFPALYFSRLNPVHTLKGEIQNRSGSVSGFKKGLFGFQFFLSLVFIIGVTAIARQYAFVVTQNHGFESDNILTIPFNDMDKQLAVNELIRHPDVKALTTSSHLPGIFIPTQVEITPNGSDTLPVNQVFIGDDFVENMNMKMIWGAGDEFGSSTQNEEMVVVNEQFLKSTSVFDLQKDSLSFTLMDGTRCRITGILEDFNFEPLSEDIDPLIFRHSLERSNYVITTINSTNIKKTIDDLDAIWRDIDQNANFEASFLDDEIEKAYYFLSAQIKIFSFLSAFAIIISCLGLLGMVSYTTENRTKEIAIRKIMGASTHSLYYLLTRDFIKLIAIAAMIAIPFSYLFYDKLFLYFLLKHGTGLGLLEIIGSILFLFLIGFASIYWQTSQVARANPANNLRYE